MINSEIEQIRQEENLSRPQKRRAFDFFTRKVVLLGDVTFYVSIPEAKDHGITRGEQIQLRWLTIKELQAMAAKDLFGNSEILIGVKENDLS